MLNSLKQLRCYLTTLRHTQTHTRSPSAFFMPSTLSSGRLGREGRPGPACLATMLGQAACAVQSCVCTASLTMLHSKSHKEYLQDGSLEGAGLLARPHQCGQTYAAPAPKSGNAKH